MKQIQNYYLVNLYSFRVQTVQSAVNFEEIPTEINEKRKSK